MHDPLLEIPHQSNPHHRGGRYVRMDAMDLRSFDLEIFAGGRLLSNSAWKASKSSSARHRRRKSVDVSAGPHRPHRPDLSLGESGRRQHKSLAIILASSYRPQSVGNGLRSICRDIFDSIDPNEASTA
jgi:hypothetical protein